MSDGIEYPGVRYVINPVHMDGTLSGRPPRMRHDPDCGHFKWGDGRISPATTRTSDYTRHHAL